MVLEVKRRLFLVRRINTYVIIRGPRFIANMAVLNAHQPPPESLRLGAVNKVNIVNISHPSLC